MTRIKVKIGKVKAQGHKLDPGALERALRSRAEAGDFSAVKPASHSQLQGQIRGQGELASQVAAAVVKAVKP